MLPSGNVRIRRVRRNLFEELNDQEFMALTRFTKDCARRLAERLYAHLRSEERGEPVSPADQVICHVF